MGRDFVNILTLAFLVVLAAAKPALAVFGGLRALGRTEQP